MVLGLAAAMMLQAASAEAAPKVAFDGMWPLGGQVVGDVSVVVYNVNGKAQVSVFGQGTDKQLWTRSGDTNGNWSDWSAAGGLMKGSPSCVAEYAGPNSVLRCFMRGMDDALWQASKPFSGQNWAFSSLGGQLASSPTAVRYHDATSGLATFVFVKNKKSGLSGKMAGQWTTNKDLFAPVPDWGSVMGGSFTGEPACYSTGTGKGINCLIKISGSGWRLMPNAQIMGAVSPEIHKTLALPTETDDRPGVATRLGQTYIFHRHPAGGMMATHVNFQGLVDGQHQVIGEPASGIGCASNPNGGGNASANGLWCAFVNSSKAVTVMFWKDGSQLGAN